MEIDLMRKQYTTGEVTLKELLKSSIVAPNGCREWVGSVARGGYGQVRRNKKLITASRLVMHLATGFDLSDPRYILHHCDNPRCIEVRHLYAGTAKQNTNDKVKRDRHSRGQRVWKARLKDTDIPKIFALHKSGTPKREIARIFDIAYSSIWRILNKQAWKHVKHKE